MATATSEKHGDVMSLVEKELKANPNIDLPSLQEKATEVDESIGELTARQFNARYPLQVKRRLSAAESNDESSTNGNSEAPKQKRTYRRKKKDFNRDEVREVFMDFAKSLAQAEDKADVVQVISDIDSYVGRVEKVVA